MPYLYGSMFNINMYGLSNITLEEVCLAKYIFSYRSSLTQKLRLFDQTDWRLNQYAWAKRKWKLRLFCHLWPLECIHGMIYPLFDVGLSLALKYFSLPFSLCEENLSHKSRYHSRQAIPAASCMSII